MLRFRFFAPLLALVVIASFLPLGSASAAESATGQLQSYPSQFATSCSSRAHPEPGDVGEVTLSRADNLVSVHVEFRATPNTTYRVGLSCIAELGEITTDSNGVGIGDFQHTVAQNQSTFGVALRTVTPSANFVATQKDLNLPYQPNTGK